MRQARQSVGKPCRGDDRRLTGGGCLQGEKGRLLSCAVVVAFGEVAPACGVVLLLRLLHLVKEHTQAPTRHHTSWRRKETMLSLPGRPRPTSGKKLRETAQHDACR